MTKTRLKNWRKDIYKVLSRFAILCRPSEYIRDINEGGVTLEKATAEEVLYERLEKSIETLLEDVIEEIFDEAFDTFFYGRDEDEIRSYLRKQLGLKNETKRKEI